MKVKIEVSRMGGGYLKATFGQTWSVLLGHHCPDAVIGRDEEELVERLRTRLPALRNQLRRGGLACAR